MRGFFGHRVADAGYQVEEAALGSRVYGLDGVQHASDTVPP